MRYQVNAIFALQTRGGLVFGCTREMEGDRVLFEAAADLDPGEQLDWRMQLRGRREMVAGTLEILEKAESGDSPIYLGRIVQISRANRQLLDQWLHEQSRSASEQPAAEATMPLPADRERRGGAGGGQHDPLLNRSKHPLAGREAIRAALRHSIATTSRTPVPPQPAPREPEVLRDIEDEPTDQVRRARPEPQGTATRPSPPRPPDPPPAPRAAAPPPDPQPAPPAAATPKIPSLPRAAPVPVRADQAPHHGLGSSPPQEPPSRGLAPPVDAPTPRPPAAREPVVTFQLDANPPLLRVCWSDLLAYRTDYTRTLRGNGLFIHAPDSPEVRERGAVFTVVLELPGGMLLRCSARVVVPMSEGAGLALDLSPKQHAVLEQVAE